jgi:hypothetical protein
VLLTWMSMLVDPPTPIVAAPKDFAMCGGVLCAKLEVAVKIKPAIAVSPICIFRKFKTSSRYNSASADP